MLKVGQVVNCEFNRNWTPRWQYKSASLGWAGYKLVDTGYSVNVVQGVVFEIVGNVARIECHPRGTRFVYEIALMGHPAYEAGQWELPGFVSLAPAVRKSVVCTCGSHATYGINNGAHSHWCDLRKAS